MSHLVMRRRIFHSIGTLFVLILTYILAVILVGRLSIFTILLLGLMFFNFFSIEYVHPQLMKGHLNLKEIIIIILNILPYTFLLYFISLVLLIPIFLLLFSVIMYLSHKIVFASVFGVVLSASLLLPWYIMLSWNTPSQDVLTIYIAWLAYNLMSSLYIESRLPHRQLNPWFVTIVWFILLPVLLYLSSHLVYLLALAEPTFRALSVHKEGDIQFNKIKQFGWMNVARSVFFSILLIFYIILK